MKDTGGGASITFSGGFVGKFEMLDHPELEIPVVPMSDLSTTAYEETMPGDLSKISTVDFDLHWDPSAALPAIGSVQTIAITGPVPAGLSNGAVFTGSGFISKIKPPQYKNNELQKGKITVQFDGVTGPSYTAAS